MLYELYRLFYPHVCSLCGTSLIKGEQFVCLYCYTQLPITTTHLSPHDNKVTQIFWGKMPVEYGLAFFYYQKHLGIQRLIHLLKYKNKPEIGIWLGRQYGIILKDYITLSNDFLLIPVPLHEKKLHLRGYNQAECFARGLSETLKIELRTDILRRKKYTETQTRKSKEERWSNVGEVFYAAQIPSLQEKHCIIVDDVITTGSTIEACAQALREQNNVLISVCVIGVATG